MVFLKRTSWKSGIVLFYLKMYFKTASYTLPSSEIWVLELIYVFLRKDVQILQSIFLNVSKHITKKYCIHTCIILEQVTFEFIFFDSKLFKTNHHKLLSQIFACISICIKYIRYFLLVNWSNRKNLVYVFCLYTSIEEERNELRI